MNVVAAPNAFKESLSNMKAAQAIEKGVLAAVPDATVVKIPLSDGGDGLLTTFQNFQPGELVHITVTGPVGEALKARYLLMSNGTTVIETALVAGLALVPASRRNPLAASSLGLGEAIKHAMSKGCRRFIIGLGGSATVDGGTGMAHALGYDFFDGGGNPVHPSGGNLHKMEQCHLNTPDPKLKDCAFRVICDVENPLLGPNGAAAVYGPQKGADPASVSILEKGLNNLAKLLQKKVNKDFSMEPGTGAAGGLGFMFKSLFNGQLIPGSELILAESGFLEALKNADFVITGEGCLDAQSIRGKIPGAVGQACAKAGVPAVGLGGILGEGWELLLNQGIETCYTINPESVPVEESMARAAEFLTTASEKAVRLFVKNGKFVRKN